MIQLPMFESHPPTLHGAPLVVGYGGGVNSLAVLIGLNDRGIVPDLIMFADTGGEWPETYSYLGIGHDEAKRPHTTHSGPLAEFLSRCAFPELVVVVKDSPQTGDRTLEDECLRRNEMPSRAYGLSSCAWRWKIEPQAKFLNHWRPAVSSWARGVKPVKILGYDAGEGHRADFAEDEKLRYWYPLREWGWDREECVRRIKLAGLPIPPKSSCTFCPSSTKADIERLESAHPDILHRALEIERRRLAKGGLETVRGLGRNFSWADFVAAKAKEREQFEAFPAEACTICSDEEEA